MIRIKILAFLAVSTLAVPFIAFGQTARPEPQTAEEVLNRCYDFLGGKKVLENYRDMKLVGVFPESEIRITIYAKKPNKLRQEAGTQVMIFDGQSGWLQKGGVTDQISGEELKGMREKALLANSFNGILSYQERGESVAFLGKESLPGQDTYVVEFRQKDGAVRRVHFSPQDYRPIKIVNISPNPQFGFDKDATYFDAYKDSGGIKASMMIQTAPISKLSTCSQFFVDDVKYNSGIDDSLFKKPEDKFKPGRVQGGIAVGEVISLIEDGSILTSIRAENMDQIGIKDKGKCELKIMGKHMQVTYYASRQTVGPDSFIIYPYFASNLVAGIRGASLLRFLAIKPQAGTPVEISKVKSTK
jgi:outer membrane lipoprotein-sorting protein